MLSKAFQSQRNNSRYIVQYYQLNPNYLIDEKDSRGSINVFIKFRLITLLTAVLFRCNLW